jgi:glycosyltransferase involved in cell wall biosynthesis
MLPLKFFAKAKLVVVAHNACDHEENALKRAAAALVFRLADQVLTHSREVQAAVQRISPRARVDFDFIPIYDVFQRSSLGQAEALGALGLSSPLVLFFGHVRKYKGLDVLLQALPLVAREIEDVRLAVAGEFWDDEAEYRNMVRENGTAGRVAFANRYVSNQEAASYFAAADVLAMPYRRATGTGPSKLALLYGVPIVGTKTGDMVDLLGRTDIGAVVEPNDPAGLARGIVEVLRRGRASYQSGIAAMRESLSWGTLAQRILADPGHAERPGPVPSAGGVAGQ